MKYKGGLLSLRNYLQTVRMGIIRSLDHVGDVEVVAYR